MKFARLLAFIAVFPLFACQPTLSPTITILDNDQVIRFQTDELVPSALLNQAGITLNPKDRVLLNGLFIALDQPISAYPITLQIRRAVTVTLVKHDGVQKIQSSAFTVGEALQGSSFWLRANDKIGPALDTPIKEGMKIEISSPRELAVSVNGKIVKIQSSARTVGEALAETGMPLIGLDYSLPAEND